MGSQQSRANFQATRPSRVCASWAKPEVRALTLNLHQKGFSPNQAWIVTVV